MPYDPNKHHRRSIRLTSYDYASEGLYFITLCCHQRQHLFGTVVEGTMQLNTLGQIVAEEWLKTLEIRPNFALGEWVIMPNHLHGVVIVRPSNQAIDLAEGENSVRAHSSAPQPPPLPAEILQSDRSGGRRYPRTGAQQCAPTASATYRNSPGRSFG